MFEITATGLITATNKQELIDNLNRECYVDFPTGIHMSINNKCLSITCICKKQYHWQYSSRIPRHSFTCQCGRLLIKYITNPKYNFISTRG